MSGKPATPGPYVGVSGVITPDQQQYLAGEFDAAGLASSRRLLLGVKATHKTQWLDVPNRHGADWFPVGEQAFAGALADTGPGMLGVAQVYLDEELVGERSYRDAFTERLVARGACWLRGVQFDLLPWQRADWALEYLSGLRERGLLVLVQCHERAMTQLGAGGCAARLAELSDGIDYVLFDSSHGTGQRMNSGELMRFLDAARSQPGLARCGLGVAGGLDARAVTELLPSLLVEHPDLSWDAEGRLHRARRDGGRPLDLDFTGAYLRASARVLSGYGLAASRLA